MPVMGLAQREESSMSKEKLVKPEGDRMAAPLKAVALVALIAAAAFVVVSIEAPRVMVAPDAPLAKTAEAMLTADGPPPEASRGDEKSTAASSPSDLHASATVSDYFPSHFPAPKGAAEAPAPTF
jgi:hypothetical protein